jgi:hypothetical protein
VCWNVFAIVFECACMSVRTGLQMCQNVFVRVSERVSNCVCRCVRACKSMFAIVFAIILAGVWECV